MNTDSKLGVIISVTVIIIALGLTEYQQSITSTKTYGTIGHFYTSQEMVDSWNKQNITVEGIQNGVKGICSQLAVYKNNDTIYCSKFMTETISNIDKYCTKLFDTITISVNPPENLNPAGVKAEKVLFVLKQLVDQDVNKTSNPLVTEFRNNCLSTTGVNP